MAHQPQPARELIANALAKIKKLAGTKKHADLAAQCQGLIDRIDEVLSPEYAARVAAAAAAAAPAAAQPQASGQQQAASSDAEAAADAAGTERAASEQGEISAGDVPGTPSSEAATASAAPAAPGSDGRRSNEGSSTGDEPAAGDAAAAGEAAAEAAAAEAAAAAAKRDADAARLAAAVEQPPPPPPPLAVGVVQPRADGAITDAAALEVMRVLQVAVATLRPAIAEVALDLLHKLIAFRYLQGAAHSVAPERQHDDEGAPGAPAPPPPAPGPGASPQALAVAIICSCDELPDEGVEVLVLRGLLTAATSRSFSLHGQALLLAVRTAYNIHLMSRSEVNQTTAKASLTQIVNVVFQRMEAGSASVAVKPIIVSDMLGTAGPGSSRGADAAGMAAAVQGFLNNVVAAAGYGGAPPQAADALRQSVAAAIGGRRDSLELGGGAAAAGVAGADAAGAGADGEAAAAAAAAAVAAGSEVSVSDDEEDERDTFSLAPASSAEPPGEAPGGGSAAAAAAPAAPAPAAPVLASQLSVGSGSALLLKDAFLVFRALCKLSIRTSDSLTVSDPTAVRGKLLALELLKVLLENSGPTFRSSERFTSAMRQYLCLSLLKNSASSIPAALQLSASIFLSLLTKFRPGLKAEVGVFFPMVMLKVLEPPAGAGGGGGGGGGAAAAQSSLAINSYSYKVVVLRCLREVCADGQLLVDLFVNYDCDIGSSNLFERLINGLVKMAQAPLPANADGAALQQEQWLRQEALQCLASAAEALLGWYRAQSGQAAGGGVPGSSGGADGEEDSLASLAPAGSSGLPPASGSARGSSASLAAGGSEPAADGGGGTPKAGAAAAAEAAAAAAAAAAGGGDALSRKRAYKEKWQEGIALFNTKPRKGIALLQAEGMLGPSPEDVAGFLAKTQGLDKTLIGDYLGERIDFNLKVMHAFVDALDFSGLEFDTAIRTFLQGFRLPGEAQKIDRLMEKFAARYVGCNPGSFKSADVGYVLAYSVIMLNTDAHNPQVKVKMSLDAFLRNNRGINDGADLPADYLAGLYGRIVSNEIKMKDDDPLGGPGGGAAAADAAAARGNLLMSALWSIVGGAKAAESAEPSDDAIKRTLDHLHERAKGATWFSASDPDTVRPMLEVAWAPLLGSLSVLFDEYSDPRLVGLCLAGCEAAAELAALLGTAGLRDVFVNALVNFTHLHTPSTMKPKNGLAFRSLLHVALAVGNHLGERWLEVLRCISRWELLQQMASGSPTDAVLFAAGPAAAGDRGTGRAAAAALKHELRRHLSGGVAPGGAGSPRGDALGAPPLGPPGPGGVTGGPGVTSMESLAMSEAAIKRVTAGPGGRGGDGSGAELELVLQPGILGSVDQATLNKVYVASASLDSDGIVSFVRCLVAISLDELRDADAPRVTSLGRLVEIAHFNMGRIRLVWSRIWAVLAQYFIAVGCHANLAVAMYAVDALRQLSMKFLERDELANFTFQHDFMRPFVVVMRQSQAVEIRELILRCLGQMVAARVHNVKSGWQSMFMVFTTAASDPDPSLVRLAFDSIERIVRSHFDAITETESTTFMDCVNCLIAFTNNPHSLEVALASIAFLRFCAARLAEGSIGDLQPPPSRGRPGHDRLGATRMVPLDEQQPPPPELPPSPSQPPPQPPQPPPQPSTLRGASPLRFSDRDEHVYFWFPLLAGLSELTFDPRPQIRRAALEVLFDTLRGHGGSFAPPFWGRVYDRVLLPVFDHVRAEVTDTTTFTSERRRAQEEGWLYDTCTHCLQHLVDLFAQYQCPMAALLPRLLGLLRGFMTRSHASLASVGVAAFARLVASCGGQLDAAGWDEVVRLHASVTRDTLPDALELVTPPVRGAGSASGLTDGAAAAGQPRPPYTLREGVGMRRLLRFRVASGVQLLLVQAGSELYAQHYRVLPPSCLVALADSLQLVASRARDINRDVALRRRLAVQQAEDRVQEERQVPDPPLLRQETEASHAYLSLLLHITSSSSSGGQAGSFQWAGAAEAQHATQAPQRLVELAHAVLLRFGQDGGGDSSSSAAPLAHANGPSALGGGGGKASGSGGAAAAAAAAIASPSVECAAFAPLVVATLRALAALDSPTFQQQLPRFFPLLTRLIVCAHATADVQRALSELFLARLGPLLAAAAPVEAAGGGAGAGGGAVPAVPLMLLQGQ